MTDQEQKEVFAKNLIKYLDLTGKTQKEVADAVGVSTQRFNTWVKAIALPRMGKVQALADYFKIDKTDLIDDKTLLEGQTKKGIQIPVLGHVSAGIPIDAIEDIIDYEDITEDLARTGKFFGLQIK